MEMMRIANEDRAHQAARDHLTEHPETPGIIYDVEGRVYTLQRAWLGNPMAATRAETDAYWPQMVADLRGQLATLKEAHAIAVESIERVAPLACFDCRERIGRAERQAAQKRGEDVTV